MHHVSEEHRRLYEDASREANWKRWGPYLAERQWGTVREDYSADGACWTCFPHDHARSRAYRWGEDGLLGFCDRECRLCFALALWNGRDAILKERLFGVTNPQGNHGEDVKESYFYLDATPTSSYCRSMYRYPQAAFPYGRLIEENGRRSRREREFELEDTGVFADGRFFEVTAEYAKAGPDDILIRVTVANRGPEAAALQVLPTLWFRNTWAWGCRYEDGDVRPWMGLDAEGVVRAEHATLGRFRLCAEPGPDGAAPRLLFTENETNLQRLYGAPNHTPWVKDAFHRYVVEGEESAVNPRQVGTKAAAHYVLDVPAGGEVVLRLRLADEGHGAGEAFGADFDRIFADRRAEAEEFYARHIPRSLSAEQKRVSRQAYAGLLHSRQFYHYVVADWLAGDPNLPSPPGQRLGGRNHDWAHLYSRDVLSVPDKWEYPWFAAWDLAFHMLPMATVDPESARQQLVLFLREWYMHPAGQLPAYEFCFSDANPPMHAWACWRVYKMSGARGLRDRAFLARTFQKLLLNFTWWVNRKDISGKHIFAGGFLGLDNVGVFDRSKPLPSGDRLDQADGTAWMAFYCGTMLSMALELAVEQPEYEDLASKFFEHYIAIVDAMNTVGGTGLWDEADGFYYDVLHADGHTVPLRVRSMVGLIPLVAVEVLDGRQIDRLPGFSKRMQWFLKYRQDLARHISYLDCAQHPECARYLLAVPSRDRLQRVLKYLLDENEFLSPFGIRSLSKVHQAHPYEFRTDGSVQRVDYEPAESTTGMFGGNSNWRGPVWFPVNYLLVEALQRYHHFYGESLQVEYPTGSGRMADLKTVATDLGARLTRLFVAGADGRRPYQGSGAPAAGPDEPVLFHEYFDGDTGRGLGASHQTGWTALVTRLLEDQARHE